MYNAGKYACTFDENTYRTGISPAPPENAKSTKISKKGFLNMIKFNFLKSLWFWLIVLIIFSFGIILYTINKNKSNNILILSTIRPITLALDNILDGIPNVEIKEISNSYMTNHICFHDFSLTPSQALDIERAKAIVINNISFEDFINNLIKDKKNLNLFDSSKNIELLKSDERTNPYIWMSITGYIKQIKNIAEFLKTIFSDKSEIINKNTENYIFKIENKLNKYKNDFEKFKGKTVATFSDEFDYILLEFGLIPIHLFDIHVHEETISAKNMNAATEKIRKNKFDFYLVSNQNKKHLDLINASGTRDIKLSLITNSDDIYIDKMSENIEKLYEALLNAKY